MIRANDAIEAVLDYYTETERPIALDDILARNRTPYVVKVRAAVMYHLHADLGLTYVDIGTVLDRDHSTVVKACRRISQKISPLEREHVRAIVLDRVEQGRLRRLQSLLETETEGAA